jgi:hypothetical protein
MGCRIGRILGEGPCRALRYRKHVYFVRGHLDFPSSPSVDN